MRIDVTPNDHVLYVSHNGERIRFTYRVWAGLRNHPTEDIFGPTNEFLEALPAEKTDRIFDLMKDANLVFSEGMEYEEMLEELTGICDKILQEIDYDHLIEWCRENANFYLDPKQKGEGNYSAAMTYTQADMFELRCVITAVKILAPIAGNFVLAIKDIISTEQKENRAGKIISRTCIQKWPGYKRYVDYIETYADRRKSAVPNGIRFGASAIEFPDWLFGLSIIRRFCIARLRSDEDGNIIAYVFNFLNERIASLRSDNYRDKFAGSGGGDSSPEAEGYSDQHRVPEDIPESDTVALQEYFKDLDIVCRDLKFTEEQVDRTLHYLSILNQRHNEYVVVPQVHYALIIFTLNQVSYCEAAEVLERQAFYTVAAATCVIFEERDYMDLVELLLSRREDKDPTVLEIGPRSNEVINRLTHDLDRKLLSCYPYNYERYTKENTNPGKLLIDNMAKAVTAYKWPDVTSLKTIRINLAEYIISLVPEHLRTQQQ